MFQITNNISIPDSEIEMSAVRSQGSGGQNVNKVSTAIHLRFDILSSSLPEKYKEKLLVYKDSRITAEGVIVIKAQVYRNQEKNREDALKRLKDLILKATKTKKKRTPTKPSKSSKEKRLNKKTKHGKLKSQRSSNPMKDI